MLEQILLKIPKVWMENNLYHPDGYKEHAKLRPFQEELINLISSTHRWFAFSIGRQCIAEDEYVYTPDGPIDILSLKDKDKIIGGSISNYNEFIDDIYEIKFINGIKIKTNKDHPFYVVGNGWKKAKDIEPRDRVYFHYANDLNLTTISHIDNSLAKLLGYFVSDGYYANGQSPKFTNTNMLFINDVKEIIESNFPIKTKEHKKGKGVDLLLTQKHGSNNKNPFIAFIESYELIKDGFGIIPSMDEDNLKAFIKGYFNGDGYLTIIKRPDRKHDKIEIGFAVGLSRKSAIDLQFILWKLGIWSYIKEEMHKKSKHIFYRLIISPSVDNITKCINILEDIKYPEKFKRAKELLSTLTTDRNKTHRNSDCVSICIKSIKYIGKGKVVGWTTNGNNEIISYCGMRTHNSGKSVTLAMLTWYRVRVLQRNVVIIAPTLANLSVLWDKVLSVVRYNDEIMRDIILSRQTPIKEIEMANGVTIKGLISGSTESKETVTLRGISGDDILVDEAAYVPGRAWRIIQPFMINNPSSKLILTSTPSEFENFFYKAFFNKQEGQENFVTRIYGTPIANPNWNPEVESQFKRTMTPSEYEREVLGQFPKSAGGLFSEDLVAASIQDYKYGNGPKEGFRYVLGVDWNQNENGGQIAVIGFNENTYYIADRLVISNVQNPQLQTMDAIITQNAKYNPDYVFVDFGYGSAQIEMLNRYGIKNPQSGLQYKIKALDFNSDDTIKVKVNGEVIRKKPKPFMVGLMQRIVQERSFIFSSSDTDGDKSLRGQLRSFKIKKQGFGTTPVYADGYFHGLIAVMIGILGIYKYYSRYSEDYAGVAGGLVVSFDRDKAFDIYNSPSKFASIRPDGNTITLEEVRENDPKWKDFIGTSNIKNKNSGRRLNSYDKPRINPSNWRPRS